MRKGIGECRAITLTINQDNFVGNTGNDTFVAGAAQDGAGSLINTLQDVDSLDGGAGTDTLQATVADAGAAAAKIAPTLKNIENVEVRFVGTQANELSLVGATGVQSITVANSTNANGVVSNVGAVANLTVKNQNVAVEFKDNTATTLNFTLDTVGKSTKAADEVVVKAATGATAATFTLNNSNVDLNTVASIKTLTVAATGTNRLDLTAAAGAVTTATVTGAGTVDLAAAFSALTTLDASANTGGVTATVDDKALTVTGGSGKDSITLSNTIAATAKIDLGAGDDTLTIAATKGITAGATLNGGDGVDTLAMDFAAYDAVTKFGATDLAKITGFEVLGITDVLADTKSVDVSKIAGITSFQTAGVANGGTASVTNLGAATQVIMKGDLATNDGTLSIALKDASGSSDAVNLTLNHSADLAAADVSVATNIAGLANVETLNIKATATDTDTTSAFTKNVTYTVAVKAGDAAALQAVNISGDQKVSFTSTVAMEKLTTIDASANTAGVTINASAADVTKASALTITGSAKADTISGTGLGDTITLGAGNDTADYTAGVSKIGTGKFDTITDFKANTYGNSAVTPGATGTGAAADATKWTGDVLKFDSGDGSAGAKVDVFTNAADATTFLANNTGFTNGIVAALDSTNNNLYVDNTGDGVADFFIKLTGVTTIDAAAFVVV